MVAKVANAVLVWGPELRSLRGPQQLVDHLNNRIAALVGLQVLSMWRTPQRHDDWSDGRLRKDFFAHASAPKELWDELFREMPSRGYSPIERRTRGNSIPTTWTEIQRETRPRGSERWIFDLARRHGIRDVFLVPVREWRVNYWSTRIIRLDQIERDALALAAHVAVARMHDIVGEARKKRTAAPPLSVRELSVLQRLSLGYKVNQIARELKLQEASVRTYLKRACDKLDAKTIPHAVSLAMRARLMQ